MLTGKYFHTMNVKLLKGTKGSVTEIRKFDDRDFTDSGKLWSLTRI